MKHIPKKSLGQHFLRSEKALGDIISAGALSSKDTVLEIGPGEGVLTECLLATGAKVIAVEKDNTLIPILTEKFKKEIKKNKLVIIEGDALDFDLKKYKLSEGKYKLIANIPYYITGAILRRFLEKVSRPSIIVILVQKEVAERIVARNKKQSILSVAVQVFGIPKIVSIVKRGSFVPAPTVDSAILSISINNTVVIPTIFFDIVHSGFAHKRKLLIRNLESIRPKEKILSAFSTLHISPSIRPEDLSSSMWLKLAELLEIA